MKFTEIELIIIREALGVQLKFTESRGSKYSAQRLKKLIKKVSDQIKRNEDERKETK